MNIGITGASGLIGRRIADLALQRGHEVFAFSRDPSRRIPGCTMRLFSQDAPPNLDSCEAVVHLAGESVLGLWTAAKKQRIAQSRILGTRRVAEAIYSDERLRDKVTAGMYVGGTGKHKIMGPGHIITHKPTLRAYPPDILLTNYKMLDYLLMRSEDKQLWNDETAAGLQFIVLDEVHSYDGAQGSDVACLLRRLYGKLGRSAESFTFVGTSATLSTSAGGEEKLLRFARQLSGAEIDRGALIGEQRVNLDAFIGNALTDYRMPRSMRDLKAHKAAFLGKIIH
jgi:DEAD/DEAH box helicase domain-containing protein